MMKFIEISLNFSNAILRSFVLIALILSQFESDAQQEWGYTQYLFNLYDINQAYAGNHRSTSFSLRHRSQWLGMEGAPVTQQFSFHAPLMNEKIGIGLRVMNESIGARKQQSVSGSCAYKIHFGEKTLSVGMTGGMIRQAIDRPKLSAADQLDVQLQNISAAVLIPVVDASVFFNTKTFYTGLQSCRINRTLYNSDKGSLARLYYNLNLVAGYMKKIGSDNLVQLSTLVKYSEGKLWQAEWNLLYLMRNKIWFGGGYRLNSGCNLLGSINITTHFRMGFSYDFPISALRKTNDGSAEIFLGYNLKNRSGKSIRYF